MNRDPTPTANTVSVALTSSLKPQVERSDSRRRRLSSLSPRAAFTLIEVLVTVTIMGIAAAIVVPSIIRPGSLTIQAASRMLISDIVLAQNEAVAQSATRRLQFDLAGNSYRLTDDSGATVGLPWAKDGYEVSFASDRRFNGVTIDSIDFGGNSWVGFDEMGGTTTGGTVDISADGYRYRVTVKPITGRVTVAPIGS